MNGNSTIPTERELDRHMAHCCQECETEFSHHIRESKKREGVCQDCSDAIEQDPFALAHEADMNH